MKIYCRVTSTGLIPLYESDLEEKRKLKVGSDVLCDISLPRKYEFHKKFMALVRLTFDNLPEQLNEMLHIHSIDDMLTCIKLDLGLCTIISIGGRDVIKIGSISFASMDETEFKIFYHKSIDMILNHYLRSTDKQDLLDGIERYK